jgi:hypothetical protein
MRQHNYCYDTCDHNRIPRRFWDETEAQGKVQHNATATSGRNEKLTCALGYKQTVSSKEAALNSIKNGTSVCLRLKKILL